MSKRICIFSLDDSFPLIDEEKIYLLKHLKKCVDYLLIICNVSHEESENKKLADITGEIYENIGGYDANRWKYGIELLNIDGRLKNTQELVLVNDSFFGPLFPLEDVFSDMEERKLDFWGMTIHGKIPRKTTFKQREKFWNRFLQTYFLCFNRRVLADESFLMFWKSLPLFKDFRDYEEHFEYILTRYFGKKFSWDAYVDTSMWEAKEADKFMSFILFQPYELIKQKRLPILSKFAVTIEKQILLNFHLGEQTSLALKYIDSNTNYDINLIYKYLIKRFNLYDLKQALNLNFVISENGESRDSENVLKRNKIAIFAHLYYEELFDYCLSYLIPLSRFIDIFITTGSEKSKEILEKKISNNNRMRIEVSTYRGREWAAFLLIDRKYMSNYDYCCLIHDKKSAQMFYPTVGKSFCDNLWENSLKSLEYVSQVIKTFEQNESVGLMVPPEVYHGTYFHLAIDFWTICFENTKQILKKMDVNVPLDISKPPVAIGSVFWCRYDAIKNLIEMNVKEDDFPAEPMPLDGSFNHILERIVPYFAQNMEYYTYTIMNEQYASLTLTNYQEMWHQIMRELKENNKLNLITFQNCLESLSRRIN